MSKAKQASKGFVGGVAYAYDTTHEAHGTRSTRHTKHTAHDTRHTTHGILKLTPAHCSNPPGNLKDDNVDSDKDSLSSSGVGGSRPSVGSLSTSLTAFELLETTRGDLNLDLNREDLQQIASSVQEVNAAMAEAIKDTGVRTEGESTLLARKAENTRAASDEFERDEAVDEIDDELGNFELDDL